MGASGVLVVDKPAGMTSHDVVARVRSALGVRRVGHAGTLDPLATGVLVLCVGEATKLARYFTAEHKSYLATVVLGTATDTLDAEGMPTAQAPLPAWWGTPAAEALLAAALEAERARSEQRPPAYSAIKIGGRAAYARSRAGEAVALAPRPVRVQALGLDAVDPAGGLTLTLTVSKGYYVRALARDLGERLGVPAHLGALRRTASGCFDLTQAAPLPERPSAALLAERLLPLAVAARLALPVATLSAEGAARVRSGGSVGPDDFIAPPTVRVACWLDPTGAPVAVGDWLEARGAPLRVFVNI